MVDRLAKLGVFIVEDLLNYFPRDWKDLSQPTLITSVRSGDEVVVRATVTEIQNKHTVKKRINITQATLVDDSGQLPAIWFNQPFLIRVLKSQSEWIFYGKVNWSYQQGKYLESPLYEKNAQILPIYPLTEGLSSKFLRKLIQPLLKLINQLADYLPSKIISAENLISLQEALTQIHFPQNISKLNQARERIAFDELLMIALRVIASRIELEKVKAPQMKIETKILQQFVAGLPFELTSSQKKAAWEIILNLDKSRPMNRSSSHGCSGGKIKWFPVGLDGANRNSSQSAFREGLPTSKSMES
jgi:ATP-dependent DNA helicase RecG